MTVQETNAFHKASISYDFIHVNNRSSLHTTQKSGTYQKQLWLNSPTIVTLGLLCSFLSISGNTQWNQNTLEKSWQLNDWKTFQ